MAAGSPQSKPAHRSYARHVRVSEHRDRKARGVNDREARSIAIAKIETSRSRSSKHRDPVVLFWIPALIPIEMVCCVTGK